MRRLLSYFWVLLVFTLPAGACRAVTIGPLERATPTAAPPRATPIPTPSSTEVLGTCPVGQQAAALRETEIPDWSSLGIDACYEIELDLTRAEPAYTGSEQVTFTNMTGLPLEEIIFRLYPNASVIYGGELSVNRARVDGIEVEPEVFLSDQTGLRLALSAPLVPLDTALIELDFNGTLPSDLGSPDAYGVFSYLSDGPVVSIANGYPILAEWENNAWQAQVVLPEGDAVVSRTAFYDVEVLVPEEWLVAASGSLIEERVLGDGNKSTHFTTGPVREVMLVASPIFSRQEIQAGDISIIHWGLPGSEDSVEKVLDVASKSIDTFTRYYGAYPYRELDIVSLPLHYAAGVEYPGLILMELELYSGPDARGFLPSVVAHEAAHQWWYGVVGNDILEHPWQDEALATFSALLYQQEHEIIPYRATLAAYEAIVREYEEENGTEPINQPLAAFKGRPQAYSTVVYLKGSLFFMELRSEMGAEEFYRALQTYFSSHLYQTAQPEDLLNAFESSCSCSLDDFYQEWGVD